MSFLANCSSKLKASSLDSVVISRRYRARWLTVQSLHTASNEIFRLEHSSITNSVGQDSRKAELLSNCRIAVSATPISSESAASDFPEARTPCAIASARDAAATEARAFNVSGATSEHTSSCSLSPSALSCPSGTSRHSSSYASTSPYALTDSPAEAATSSSENRRRNRVELSRNQATSMNTHTARDPQAFWEMQASWCRRNSRRRSFPAR
jgi:hypothetical protein